MSTNLRGSASAVRAQARPALQPNTGRRLALAAGLAALVAALLAPSPARAGSEIINANPHAILNCTSSTPPQAAVAMDSAIDVNAYHTRGNASGSYTPNCVVDRILNAFPSYSKPKIVSSDGGQWTNQDVLNWIPLIKNAGAHYEHFEKEWNVCSGTCPMEGDLINDASDFPTASASIRTALGGAATRLLPNGTLTRSLDKLYWTGSGSTPITLMGYSWTGALTGLNFDIEGYLDVLQSHGINLTRVWALEQWTALAVQSPNAPVVANGVTPFGGNLTAKWDLDQLNNAYFTRARQFVQAAADRGIVVQLSVFDRHGLINAWGGATDQISNDWGRWDGSPYKQANNTDGYFSPPADGKAPPAFLGRDGTTIGGVHRAYLARLATEIGAYGNVVFEVMNEPLDGEWADDEVWHHWVADVLRGEFARTLVTAPRPTAQSVVPGGTAHFTVEASGASGLTYRWQRLAPGAPSYVNLVDNGRITGSLTPVLRIASVSAAADAGSYRCLINGTSGASNSGPGTLTVLTGGVAVRDGFGAPDGTLLNGRTTETGGKVWSATNAKITGAKARGNGEQWRVLGGVPVSLAGLKTATVEADLRQGNTGAMAIGFPAGAATALFDQTNNSVWVEFTRAGDLTLRKRTGGVITVLGTVPMTALGFTIGQTVNVRLVYRTSPTPRADVYVDSVRRITNATLGFTPTIGYAGFQAKRGSSTQIYGPNDGDVDNFVVTLSTQ